MKSGTLTPQVAPLLRSGEGFLGRTRRPRHENGGSSRSLSPPQWAPWSSPVLRQCYLWEEGAVLVSVHVMWGWPTRFLANTSGEWFRGGSWCLWETQVAGTGPTILVKNVPPWPWLSTTSPGTGPPPWGRGRILSRRPGTVAPRLINRM